MSKDHDQDPPRKDCIDKADRPRRPREPREKARQLEKRALARSQARSRPPGPRPAPK